MRSRFTASCLAVIMGASLLTVATLPARAGSSGRKNVALGLGAIAAYELFRGKTTPGLLAAAGAYYAYTRYQDARKSERRFRFPNRFSANGYANSSLRLARARSTYRRGRYHYSVRRRR